MIYEVARVLGIRGYRGRIKCQRWDAGPKHLVRILELSNVLPNELARLINAGYEVTFWSADKGQVTITEPEPTTAA